MNRIPLQTSVSIPKTSNSPKLLTSSLPVYSTLLPQCGGSLSVGSLVISQHVVTAFPSASDPLWTHGFSKTGHLVFPWFNILPLYDGSLSVGSIVTSPGLKFFHGVMAAFPSAPGLTFFHCMMAAFPSAPGLTSFHGVMAAFPSAP